MVTTPLRPGNKESVTRYSAGIVDAFPGLGAMDRVTAPSP